MQMANKMNDLCTLFELGRTFVNNLFVSLAQIFDSFMKPFENRKFFSGLTGGRRTIRDPRTTALMLFVWINVGKYKQKN